jgi:hypothetical protein
MEYSILVMKREQVEREGSHMGEAAVPPIVKPEFVTRTNLIVAPDKKALHAFIRDNNVRPHRDINLERQGAHMTATGDTVWFFKNPPVVLKPQYRA